MAGCKDEHEFYSKYPTEQSFMEAFPQAVKYFQQGGSPEAFPQQPTEHQFFDYGPPTPNIPRLMQFGGDDAGPVRPVTIPMEAAGVNIPEVTKYDISLDGLSFGKAFNAARAAGLKTFAWRGKKYTTQLKSEVKKGDVKPVSRIPSVKPSDVKEAKTAYTPGNYVNPRPGQQVAPEVNQPDNQISNDPRFSPPLKAIVDSFNKSQAAKQSFNPPYNYFDMWNMDPLMVPYKERDKEGNVQIAPKIYEYGGDLPQFQTDGETDWLKVGAAAASPAAMYGAGKYVLNPAAKKVYSKVVNYPSNLGPYNKLPMSEKVIYETLKKKGITPQAYNAMSDVEKALIVKPPAELFGKLLKGIGRMNWKTAAGLTAAGLAAGAYEYFKGDEPDDSQFSIPYGGQEPSSASGPEWAPGKKKEGGEGGCTECNKSIQDATGKRMNDLKRFIGNNMVNAIDNSLLQYMKCGGSKMGKYQMGNEVMTMAPRINPTSNVTPFEGPTINDRCPKGYVMNPTTGECVKEQTQSGITGMNIANMLLSGMNSYAEFLENKKTKDDQYGSDYRKSQPKRNPYGDYTQQGVFRPNALTYPFNTGKFGGEF